MRADGFEAPVVQPLDRFGDHGGGERVAVLSLHGGAVFFAVTARDHLHREVLLRASGLVASADNGSLRSDDLGESVRAYEIALSRISSR
jgi:hypothetical protein